MNLWNYEKWTIVYDSDVAMYLSEFGICIKVINLSKTNTIYLVPDTAFIDGLIDEYKSKSKVVANELEENTTC